MALQGWFKFVDAKGETKSCEIHSVLSINDLGPNSSLLILRDGSMEYSRTDYEDIFDQINSLQEPLGTFDLLRIDGALAIVTDERRPTLDSLANYRISNKEIH